MNLLEASSENLLTRINPVSKEVGFKVQVTSFNFSNCSRLVEKVFNDVYMESHKYHWAQFEGKIIDSVNFSISGEYKVSAKGKLSLHGVTKQRIIEGKVIVRESGHLGFESKFTIPLSEHNISILKDDTDRLAEIIQVEVSSAVKIN